jgi:RNA polymerase subunit RPABC4/transcription elongation factor Spt4
MKLSKCKSCGGVVRDCRSLCPVCYSRNLYNLKSNIWVKQKPIMKIEKHLKSKVNIVKSNGGDDDED